MTKTIEERVTVLEEQSKAVSLNQQKQDALLHEIHAMNVSIKEVHMNVNMMQKNLEKTQVDLDALKQKGGLQMDHIIKTVINAVVAGIITFILVQIGLR